MCDSRLAVRALGLKAAGAALNKMGAGASAVPDAGSRSVLLLGGALYTNGRPAQDHSEPSLRHSSLLLFVGERP